MNYQSESNKDKSTLYSDNPITRKLDVNGKLVEYINSEALAQAFKVWLVSGRGEKIRSSSGGWLIPYLGKPINNDTAERIKKNILLGLTNDFIPKITVTNIQVIPDYQNNRWIITVEGYNAQINIGLNTYAVVKNGV